MTTISGAAPLTLPPVQLEPLPPAQPLNNGATDCFPDDMMQRLETQQAGQAAGSTAAGIIGDCLPQPDGLPDVFDQVRLEDVAFPLDHVDPDDVAQPMDITQSIIGDCTPMPEGWPTLQGEASVREEIYLDDNGQVGTRTVVDAGDGDDSVQVTRHEDGSATVTVNGERHELTAEQARTMRVTGGAGDDTITVTDNRGPAARLQESLSGDRPRVQGGEGSDRFEGQTDGVDVDNNIFEGDTVNGKLFP